MATDLDQLNVTMNAKFDTFSRQLAKTDADFNKAMNSILAKKKSTEKALSLSLPGAGKFLGIDRLGGALAGLTGVAIVGGMGELISKSLDAAKAIGEVAEQAGVAPERLQTLRYAVSQNKGNFQDLDNALIFLNKTFGEFVNTGAGKGAQTFKTLGLQAAINNGQVRDTAQAFDFVVNKIRGYTSESQRAAFAAGVFGKEAGPKMMGFINAGASAVSELEAKAKSLGIVLSSETIAKADEARDKLDTLFQVIKVQGVNAVASLAPQIADLAQQITDGLPDLLLWVERWADWFGLIKLSPVDKLRAQISDLQGDLDKLDNKNGSWWNWLTTPIIGKGTIRKNLQDQIAQAKADLAKANNLDFAPGGAPAHWDAAAFLAGSAKPLLHVNDIQGAKDAEQLAQKRKEILDKIGVDQATADAALLAAQNELQVKLLTGQAGYHAAVQKQIDDELAAKITTINAEEKKELDSLDRLKLGQQDYAAYKAKIEAETNAKIETARAESKGKTFDAGSGSIMQAAGTDAERQIQSYKDQITNLGLVEGALAAATYYESEFNAAREKGIELSPDEIAALKAKAALVGQAAQTEADAAKISQRNVEVLGDLRSGLEDVGAAGIHGFKSMKDAAAQFLEQLAALIIKLYVMKPLVESLLGPSGGGLGGLLGGLFGSIGGGSAGIGKMGFADGGVFVPGRGSMPLRRFAGGGVSRDAAIFGEAGPEAAVPLPDGRRIPVALRLPSMRQMGRGAQPVSLSFAIDARGAQIGVAEQIDRKLRAAAPLMIDAAVRRSRAEFPNNMANAMQNVF